MTDAKWDGEIHAAMPYRSEWSSARDVNDNDRAIARHFFAKGRDAGIEEAAGAVAEIGPLTSHTEESLKAEALARVRALAGGGNEDGK